jgi:hypothetical protein
VLTFFSCDREAVLYATVGQTARAPLGGLGQARDDKRGLCFDHWSIDGFKIQPGTVDCTCLFRQLIGDERTGLRQKLTREVKARRLRRIGEDVRRNWSTRGEVERMNWVDRWMAGWMDGEGREG